VKVWNILAKRGKQRGMEGVGFNGLRGDPLFLGDLGLEKAPVGTRTKCVLRSDIGSLTSLGHW